MAANGAFPDAASSLTRKVYARLRKDLLTRRWRPGGRLPMRQLRTCYDSGASPLREALSRLATEGLVVHNDQRGFTVAAVSQCDYQRTAALFSAPGQGKKRKGRRQTPRPFR